MTRQAIQLYEQKQPQQAIDLERQAVQRKRGEWLPHAASMEYSRTASPTALLVQDHVRMLIQKAPIAATLRDPFATSNVMQACPGASYSLCTWEKLTRPAFTDSLWLIP